MKGTNAISALCASVTIALGGIAPASANPIANNLLVERASQNLIDLEGIPLSDSESARVAGEAWWIVAIPVGAALGGVGINAYQNVRNGRPWNQNWASSGAIGATAGVCAVARFNNPSCASLDY